MDHVVIAAMVTPDRRYKILIHEDQTAELSEERGALVLGRTTLSRITDWLAEQGYDELVRE